MKRELGLVVAGIVAATSLSACGSGSSAVGNYCSTYKSVDTRFGHLDVSSLDGAKFHQVLDSASKLESEAPTARLKKDWHVATALLGTLQKDLKQAGISFTDFKELSQGRKPAGVSRARLARFATQMRSIESQGTKMDSAQQDIKDYARNTCHLKKK
ncbi:MAG: hypothetical protein ACRDPH_07210 [Marmoricola sp.]